MSTQLGDHRSWLTVTLAMLAASVWLQSAAAAAPPPTPMVPSVVADDASRAAIFKRLEKAEEWLRRGRPDKAARAFREVFLAAQGTEWGTLAELGLAWSTAAGGKLELGRAYAEDAHASAGVAAGMTSVVFALLSARAGDYAVALEQLDVVARSASQPSKAKGIHLLRAYVIFWSGEFTRAAVEFEMVGNADSSGELADDARYGAAWSRWKAGDGARALSELDRLVRDAPPDFQFRRVRRRLVKLDKRAVLGASTRRSQRGGIHTPDAQLARLLDSDGYSRARSALRLLDSGNDQTAKRGSGLAADAVTDLSFADTRVSDHPARDEAKPVPGIAAKRSGETTPPPPPQPPVFAVAVLLALMALGVGVAWARRRQASALPKQLG